MWKLLDKTLNSFRSCFTRQASFEWFVIIIIGLMMRSDVLGLTSVIRDLSIAPKSYPSLMHFFRAQSWQLENLINQWMRVVQAIAPVCKEDGMTLLVGDGVKQAKEARKMPGVKRHHQESENSSKAEYIFGHLLGGVGVLIGNRSKKLFCVPLSIRLHDGVKAIRRWSQQSLDQQREGSHVVQMVTDGFRAAQIMGKSLLLLDRYYLTVPALNKLSELNGKGEALLHILTRAKISSKAYEKPGAYKGKGRPRKKGEEVKLRKLFQSRKNEFVKETITMYGKEQEVHYLCLNLLWGQGLYQELRFVLVTYKGKQAILVSTKLDLDPIKIIELYSFRFKIECTFRELKQVVGGFSYQFWSKVMPRLNRFSKKGQPDPIANIHRQVEQQQIVSTVKAIEGYVLCSCIAIGLLQILSLKYSYTINKTPFRYLRTKSNDIVSEATIACYMRKNIFLLVSKKSQLGISQIIKKKQEDPLFDEDLLAS